MHKCLLRGTGAFALAAGRMSACALFARRMSACALLLASIGAQAGGNEIVVGEIVDQSPNWIEAGRDYAAGAKTYFDLVNSEGGINGHKIVHIVKNSTGQSAEVMKAAGELLNDSRADVLFGPIGDATMKSLAEAHIADKQNVAVFAPLTGLSAPGQPRIRTMRASYADEAQALTKHFTNLGLTSFCIVSTPGEEQKASVAAVRAAVAAIGRKLVCETTLAEIGGDPAKAAATVRAARPQAVFVLGDTSVVGNFLRVFPFKSLGITVGALSLVNSTTLLEIAGPAASRGLVITQVVPSTERESVPIVREHVRAMKKFRDEPPSAMTLEGFIAAKTMVEALRRGLGNKPVKREDVTAVLAGLPDSAMTELLTDYAASSSGGGHLIEVTMIGSDGRLIQ